MWMIRKFCENCGWSREVYEFCTDDQYFCSNCGQIPAVFYEKVVHKVSDAKWYNPLTWGDCRWEDRHGIKYGV